MKKRAFITLTFEVDLDQVPGFGHQPEDWVRYAEYNLCRDSHYIPIVTIHRTEVKPYKWDDNAAPGKRWIRPKLTPIELGEK